MCRDLNIRTEMFLAASKTV